MRGAKRRERCDLTKQLILKMHNGECNAWETWTLQKYLVDNVLGASEEWLKGLLYEEPESPQDAWLGVTMALHYINRSGREALYARAVAVLEPYQEDPLCAALLGLMYQLVGYFDLAFDCFQKSAEKGCAEGIYRLGLVYTRGHGVERSAERGFKLFLEAGEMSHPDALACATSFLSREQGMERNARRMIHFYEQASRLGCVNATCLLARCYLSGIDVPKDIRHAARLYRQAVLDGSSDAELDLGCLVKKFPLDVIPYGEWQPDPFTHQFVTHDMHHQMRTILLMHSRKGSLFSKLPKDIVLRHICFWLCTDPYP